MTKKENADSSRRRFLTSIVTGGVVTAGETLSREEIVHPRERERSTGTDRRTDAALEFPEDRV